MIGAAAGSDCIFFKWAQERHGFAGIVDSRPGAFDGVHKTACEGGNAGKPTQKVEHEPFGGKEQRGLGVDACDDGTGRDLVAVADLLGKRKILIQAEETRSARKRLGYAEHTGYDAAGTVNEFGIDAVKVSGKCVGGKVGVADIFGEGAMKYGPEIGNGFFHEVVLPPRAIASCCRRFPAYYKGRSREG